MDSLPTVLIPGLGTTPLLYSHQIPALWEFGPVMVANQTRQSSMGAIAHDILAHAPPRFALAGLSMGGYIAFEIMRQAPDRVLKLALLDTSARADTAEQTERLDVPEIRHPAKLEELLAGWSPERRLLVCAEFGQALPIAQALSQLPPDGAYAVMTGPEGGFARSELDALGKLPFVTAVGLGPRVLRADTAALAALSCWQAILGDGRKRPPTR